MQNPRFLRENITKQDEMIIGWKSTYKIPYLTSFGGLL